MLHLIATCTCSG